MAFTKIVGWEFSIPIGPQRVAQLTCPNSHLDPTISRHADGEVEDAALSVLHLLTEFPLQLANVPPCRWRGVCSELGSRTEMAR